MQYFNGGSLPSDHYVLSQPEGMAARMSGRQPTLFWDRWSQLRKDYEQRLPA